MEIFAISVVKNEVDIIAQCLAEATKWAHKIFILDNGRTDGTWELVQSVASDKTVPWRQEFTPFYDDIRAQVFNEVKHLVAPDDWCCFRLNADDFYVDNPITFLAGVPWYHHFVVTDTSQFRLKKEGFADGQAPADISEVRYYNKKTWNETRFFRHRNRLIWTPEMKRPKHMGIMHTRRIKLRHYQFRSLNQIRQRVLVRAEAKRNGYPGFVYSIDENINSYLHNRADLNWDADMGEYQLEGPQNHLYQRWYDVALKPFLHAVGIYN